MSLAFLAVSFRSRFFRELAGLSNRVPTLTYIFVSRTTAVIGVVLTYLAMFAGPISAVSAVLGSRPLYVVILALVLSRIKPGLVLYPAKAGTAGIKLLAAAMIVGGIAALYLT